MPRPRLLALGRATPPYRLEQATIRNGALTLVDPKGVLGLSLSSIFENTGIATRASAVPLLWHARARGWRARTDVFEQVGTALVIAAAEDCLARAGIAAEAVDAVVLVSTTGVATPTLDARAMATLGLREDVIRLPVFGLGCAGGTLGLARAADLAAARPGSRVLMVSLELCTPTFRRGDLSATNVVAAALFGDGAAAVLVSTEGDGPEIAASAEHTWRDSLDVMGWRVEDDGLAVLMSREIPTVVSERLAPVVDRFLARHGLDLTRLDRIVAHPGGPKVVTAIEGALGLAEGSLAAERAVLRRYGNMSSPTVLFVLGEHLDAGPIPGLTLMMSLGPGFTAGLLLLAG